jgi:hypothetical protein
MNGLVVHPSKLVLWLSKRFQEDSSAFPGIGKKDYVADFLSLDKYLNENVHPHVETLARIADSEGYLTDHGPGHIKMVMHRACKIIDKSLNEGGSFDPALRPYETFLLLMAIHFHDIGNRYGREGHEQRILDQMNDIPIMGSFSTAEKRTIAKIASTHGGKVGDSKDTIGQILPEGQQTLSDVTYRPQMIAAVLRLADELAEDSSRADNFALLQAHMIPEESQIYHKYAQRLDSVFTQTISMWNLGNEENRVL